MTSLMLPIVISTILSLTYWQLYDIRKVLPTRAAAAIKWLSVVILAVNSQHYQSILTAMLYSLGDVAIVIWSEEASLPFFGAGHIIFLYMNSTKVILTQDIIIVLVSLVTTTCVICFLRRREIYLVYKKDQKYLNMLFIIIKYWLYVYVLHLYLFFPLMKNYYGTILFIVSDFLIGFKITKIKIFEWPLYWLSVVYLTSF